MTAAVLCLVAAVSQGGEGRIAVLPAQVDAAVRSEVPDILDDYILTAVQEVHGGSVIGQDDINTMLGFERQKELAGCDDLGCLAEIGGALGVDKIVVFKIARVGNQWATSGKIINIRTAEVEERSSDFVDGDVGALLRGVPQVVGSLFGKSTAAPREQPKPTAEQRISPAESGSAEPTGIELGVSGTIFFLGGEDDLANPPIGVTLTRRFAAVLPRISFRETDIGTLSLWLELAGGLGVHRRIEAESNGYGGTSSSTGEDYFLHGRALQVFRIPLRQQPAGWVPSDSRALDIGAGVYYLTGGTDEFGLVGRVELHLNFVSLAGLVTWGGETGLQPGGSLGFRFGL